MHVLVLSHPYSAAYGGGERYLETLVAGLMTRDFRFELVTSSAPLLDVFQQLKLPARPSDLGPEPVSKRALPLFVLKAPYLLARMYFIIRRAKRTGTEAVVCLALTDKLLATPLAKLLKMKVFWVEHLVPGRSLTKNPLRPFYAALSRLVTVVTVSQAVVNGLMHLGVPRENIEIIPPGIEMPIESASLRSATVGVVARLAPEKNVALALRAFKRVSAAFPNAHLDIFGDGPERAELEKLAESLGINDRIAWRGFTNDPKNIYPGLRVLAVPSRAESFGLAALEAMSWGVPVVATEVGGLPELIQDEITGLLVPGDDETALAAAILRVLEGDDLAARLGANGRTASGRWSIRWNLAAWEKLLKS